MTTKLERIAAKAREEANLQFTSLCHHITRELLWENLCHIDDDTSPGVDGVTAAEAKKDFPLWVEPMLTSIHNMGYRAPIVRRVWIPKSGKSSKRPLGVPCVADRALQRSASQVLSCIYEQDFLPCSFGGRPGIGQPHALSTLNEVICGKKVSWILEADLKNFFGSLDHGWLLRFVEHRVGDPRILNLIKRWLKAGILEDGEVHQNEMGTPQGGSISVLLSNIYLHYVLDLWFERAIKRRLKGTAYLVRYIDDFAVCFQYRSDALRFQEALGKRLGRFSLELEPGKTCLVAFGRFASRDAKRFERKLETFYFLGFTHYCTFNRKGNFMVGRKTEKGRLKRSLDNLRQMMRHIRHEPLSKQSQKINQVLSGHYNYYGLGGNLRSLHKVYRFTERYWHRMLCSRSQKSYIRWDRFQQLKDVYPLRQPRLILPYSKMKSYAVL
jgi:group II intron reverse transcriptase/maturase